MCSSQDWLCFHNNRCGDLTSPCPMSPGLGDTAPEFTSLQRSDSSGSYSAAAQTRPSHLLWRISISPLTLSLSFCPLSFLFTTKALPFFNFSPECSEYTYHGFLVGEVAHASALLTLQEWEWLCWKVLERRPLDTKELGHFLSRKASLTSYGLASVSDSSGNLI